MSKIFLFLLFLYFSSWEQFLWCHKTLKFYFLIPYMWPNTWVGLETHELSQMNFNLQNSSQYFSEIKKKWEILQRTPGIFAYQLNVKRKMYLYGKWNFYAELNLERSALRRAPQVISSLKPTFDENIFNFKKVHSQERLLDIQFEGGLVSVIINKSPLTEYHTLLCPNVDANHPQVITSEAINFCATFLLQLESERLVRIGYNSPGALASVNHLHLHLLYIDADLYIDKAELELLSHDYVYRLSKRMPTEAICFIISKLDSDATKENKLKQISEFLQWLCTSNLPHNIFITSSREAGGKPDCIKLFVFAREKHCIIKDVTAFNIGFCELSGYIPLGSEELFQTITEEKVISKITKETGEAFSRIYSYFLNITKT